MEAAPTLCCTLEVRQSDSELLRGFVLQTGSRGATDREV